MIQKDTAEAGDEAQGTGGQAAPEPNSQDGQKTQTATEPATVTPPPAGPPKSQLRRRLEERIAELEAALEKIAEDPAKQKQARAIAMALKGVHDWMTPGGAPMGPMESAQMSRWLETTKYLGQSS